MVIYGIGIDIVEIERMRGVVERWGDKFLERVFTHEELVYCQSRTDPIPHLAARFAAKESVVKALMNSKANITSLYEIEIAKDSLSGAPYVKLSGATETFAKNHTITSILISISHTATYAVSQIIALSSSLH